MGVSAGRDLDLGRLGGHLAVALDLDGALLDGFAEGLVLDGLGRGEDLVGALLQVVHGVGQVAARLPFCVQSSAGLYANTLARLIVVTSTVSLGVPTIEFIPIGSNKAGVYIAIDIGNAVVRELRVCIRGSTTITRSIRDVNELIGNHGLEDGGQGDVAGHLKGGAGGHFVAVLVDPAGELVVERSGDRNALDHCQGAIGVLVAVDRSHQTELRISGCNLICDSIDVTAPTGVELNLRINGRAQIEGLPIPTGGLREPTQEGVGIALDLLGDAGLLVQLDLVKNRARIHGEIDTLIVSLGSGGVDLHLHLRGDPLGVYSEVASWHRAREHLSGRNSAILILEPSAEGIAVANWHVTACVCA